MLSSTPTIYIERFEERLFPCNITRDDAGKKQVRLPKGWNDSGKLYEDFDESDANSIALRTGSGLVVVDIDTKDLTLLEAHMSTLVSKWLNDKATFTVETTNGYHFYFDSDDKSYGNAVRISNYIDIRGDGGCVFCYTQDESSSYTVLCEAEPLPLTDELLEYISIQERDAKTIKYEYDDNDMRIVSTPHNPNKALKKALSIEDDMQRAIAILEAIGKSVADFENTSELYSKTNALTYILAMNPSYPNNDVRSTIEYIIENISGFNINSQESQKRLNQIFSTMIYSDERAVDIRSIFAECSVEVESNLERLHADLLFLKHGYNLIIGESKAGKTYTTIKSLVDTGFKDDVIHVDFDRNADKKLGDLGVETYHISDAESLFAKLGQQNNLLQLKEKIIVIDSLQDIALEDGLDDNKGALKTMQRLEPFGSIGATLIVIHHVTMDDGKPKIKGNATVISSKVDVTIKFTKVDYNCRKMEVLSTRAEDVVASGKSISFGRCISTTAKLTVPAKKKAQR